MGPSFGRAAGARGGRAAPNNSPRSRPAPGSCCSAPLLPHGQAQAGCALPAACRCAAATFCGQEHQPRAAAVPGAHRLCLTPDSRTWWRCRALACGGGQWGCLRFGVATGCPEGGCRGLENAFKGKWDLRKAPSTGEASSASLASPFWRSPRGRRHSGSGLPLGPMRLPGSGSQRAASPCLVPRSPALAACGRLTPKSPLQPLICLFVRCSISFPFAPGLNHVSWCFLMSCFPEFVPVTLNPPHPGEQRRPAAAPAWTRVLWAVLAPVRRLWHCKSPLELPAPRVGASGGRAKT